jgi:hypothetical protein
MRTNSIEHIKTGKLRALAVTAGARWAGLLDVEPIAKPTARLNKEINAALADQKIMTRLADLGAPLMLSPGSVTVVALLMDDINLPAAWGKDLAYPCRSLRCTVDRRLTKALPRLLTAAACGGLGSAPDCRTRRALLHLSYSCASPFGPAVLVTQDP